MSSILRGCFARPVPRQFCLGRSVFLLVGLLWTCTTRDARAQNFPAPGFSTYPAPPPSQVAPSALAARDLGLYRSALDLILRGNAPGARSLLESAARSGNLPSECALLLAGLQDHAGDAAAARNSLAAIEAPSPLCQAYLQTLGGAPRPAIQTVDTSVRLPATDPRITRLEAELIDLVNGERVAMGLGQLTFDPRMAEIARAHSAEMRDLHYFSHQSPTARLENPMDRYCLGMGSTPHIVAENIYWARGGHSFLNDVDLHQAHEDLMHSPGHRANILDPDINRIGIGIVSDGSGAIWITQLFARPMDDYQTQPW